MSYRNCPHCRASNRSADTTCYNCSRALDSTPKQSSEDFLLEMPVGLGGTSEVGNVPAGKPLGAITFSVLIGAGLGVGLELLGQDLALELQAVMICVLVATLTATFLASWADLPPGTSFSRILPAAVLGGLAGAYCAAVCWSFEPDLSPWAFGALAGFFAGTPVMVSFGFAGGQSRAPGLSELGNFAIDFAVAILFGGIFALESDLSNLPGLAGGLALLMMVFGGRVNMWQIARAYQRMKDD